MPRGRPRRPQPLDYDDVVIGHEDDADSRTIGPGINDLMDEPVLPGFAMTDAEDDAPVPSQAVARNAAVTSAGALDGELLPPPSSGSLQNQGAGAPGGVNAGLVPPGAPIRYESRIRVLEAFQYRGSLQGAPAWVDRSWAGYGDWDPLRNIAAGPALRVPSPHGDVVLARPGDYVVRQSVTIAHHVEPDIQVEVWAREAFERTFLPAGTSDLERSED